MIVFDLDGVLACCEHRRHFVEAPEDVCYKCFDYLMNPESIKQPLHTCSCGRQPGIWKLNWQEFYEACDQDKPIYPVINLWNKYEIEIALDRIEIQVWSGRCESHREKTIEWLDKYLFTTGESFWSDNLKMRPIGDSKPDEQLKERWLDEALAAGKTIDFVVDGNKESVYMWKKRGVFVFDVSQDKGDF